MQGDPGRGKDFPSFSEGLSLRVTDTPLAGEGLGDFPSFSEGLSLRVRRSGGEIERGLISLPFRRDFH